MKRLTLIGILILGLTQVAFAYGDWVKLTQSDSKKIDYKYAKCYYHDILGNHNVSIIIKGSMYHCPSSIKYNPISGQWKK
jgi:hypothetical protein